MTIDEIKSQGYEPVIFFDSRLFKSLKKDEMSKLLEKLKNTGLKIYTPETENFLLRVKRTCVIRYGFLSDKVAGKVKLKGGKIVSGDL